MKKTKKPKLLVTFDDAYLDFYENALPILQKYKIPAVQHVITQCAESGESFWTQKLNKIIDAYYLSNKKLVFAPLQINTILKNPKEAEKTAIKIYLYLLNQPNKLDYIEQLYDALQVDVSFTRMMNWQQIKECASNNIVIGSHTHSHANLLDLDKDELYFELKHSLSLIEKNIPDYAMKYLAYPNGQYNSKVEKAAIDCGYTKAFSTKSESTNNLSGSYTLPRYSLYNREWWKNRIKLNLIRYIKAI